MKVVASRVERDTDDIASLYRLSGFKSVAEAIGYVQRAYPHLTLLPRVQDILDGLDSATQLGPPSSLP